MKTKKILLLLGLCAATLQLPAQIIVNFPEVNSTENTSGFPLPAVTVATDNYTIPAGQDVVSATFSGIFGETSEFNGSSAEAQLFLNGVMILDSMTLSPTVQFNDVSFNVTIPAADLSLLDSGSATLSYVQTSEYIVRLSDTTLTMNTGQVSAVPEPSTVLAGLSLLLPLGLSGAQFLRRKLGAQ